MKCIRRRAFEEWRDPQYNRRSPAHFLLLQLFWIDLGGLIVLIADRLYLVELS